MVSRPPPPGWPAPPSSLWTDPTVFAATFLAVPSFTRPRHAPEASVTSHWLASALFTPPPGEPSSSDAANELTTPVGRAEPRAGRPISGAAPDSRPPPPPPPRVYSRAALLALRPPAGSPLTDEVVWVAYLLSSASENFDESRLPPPSPAAASIATAASPAPCPVPPGVRTDVHEAVRNRLERVAGVAQDVLHLTRAAKGEVALFRLRFFVELAQSLVVTVMPASGERLRCFEEVLATHVGKGPHCSVRLSRSTQKLLLWWCNDMVTEHAREQGGADGVDTGGP